jgi:hypothetical protein
VNQAVDGQIGNQNQNNKEDFGGRMPKKDGQGTVGSHPIAFVVFQILDNVPDQHKKIQIKGVIDDQQPKVFKIKGDGKKGKNHQGRGNKVTDPKQPFKAAGVGPYGQDKKSKKQQRLKGHKPGGKCRWSSKI